MSLLAMYEEYVQYILTTYLLFTTQGYTLNSF